MTSLFLLYRIGPIDQPPALWGGWQNGVNVREQGLLEATLEAGDHTLVFKAASADEATSYALTACRWSRTLGVQSPGIDSKMNSAQMKPLLAYRAPFFVTESKVPSLRYFTSMCWKIVLIHQSHYNIDALLLLLEKCCNIPMCAYFCAVTSPFMQCTTCVACVCGGKSNSLSCSQVVSCNIHPLDPKLLEGRI